MGTQGSLSLTLPRSVRDARRSGKSSRHLTSRGTRSGSARIAPLWVRSLTTQRTAATPAHATASKTQRTRRVADSPIIRADNQVALPPQAPSSIQLRRRSRPRRPSGASTCQPLSLRASARPHGLRRAGRPPSSIWTPKWGGTFSAASGADTSVKQNKNQVAVPPHGCCRCP